MHKCSVSKLGKKGAKEKSSPHNMRVRKQQNFLVKSNILDNVFEKVSKKLF